MEVSLRLAALLTMSAALAGQALATETQTYTYDELGRLVAVTSSGTINNNQKHSICYDPAGNRTQYKSDSAGAGASCGAVATPPSLSIAAASATEGGALAFVVTRTGDTSTAVSASYSTASGTATLGSDFTAAAGTVSFAAGQTSATVTVATIDDTAIESAETMTVALTAPTGGAVLGTASATGTINDNDTPAPPSLSIAPTSATEGGALAFVVTRTGDTSTAVSASYSTASGTAISGSDFTAAAGTVSFTAGQTSATVTVATIDDTTVESAEAMTVTLTTPTGGAVLGTSSATGTINDNDSAAPPSYLAISDAAGLEGATLVFTVTRSGSTTSAVSVNFATANGTAVGTDYFAVSGTITFAPGETSKTISVVAKTNLAIEPDEVFYLNLSGATGGATVTDSQGAGTIYDDSGGGCNLC